MAGIGSSIAGGVMGSNAATQAANVQATAAQQAQQLEQQNQQQGLQFNQGVWNQDQSNQQPFLQLGQTSANALRQYLQNPFTAPTLAQAEATPGYQFNLQSGTQAINENAAATGNLQSGNTGVALQKYGQGLATTTYQQAYQNALNQYQTNYSDLMGGTQVGANAANSLGAEGASAAQNESNLDLTGGAQQAQQINNAAAARASGYVGSANAWGNALNGATSDLTSGLLMNSLYNNGSFNSSSYAPYQSNTGYMGLNSDQLDQLVSSNGP